MTVPQPLTQVGDLARRTQAAGFDGMLFTETARTAYLNAAVASQAAPDLELSTGVAEHIRQLDEFLKKELSIVQK